MRLKIWHWSGTLLSICLTTQKRSLRMFESRGCAKKQAGEMSLYAVFWLKVFRWDSRVDFMPLFYQRAIKNRSTYLRFRLIDFPKKSYYTL